MKHLEGGHVKLISNDYTPTSPMIERWNIVEPNAPAFSGGVESHPTATPDCVKPLSFGHVGLVSY